MMCAMHLAHDFRVSGNSKSELSKMIYPSTLHLQRVVTYRVYLVSRSVTYFTAPSSKFHICTAIMHQNHWRLQLCPMQTPPGNLHSVPADSKQQ